MNWLKSKFIKFFFKRSDYIIFNHTQLFSAGEGMPGPTPTPGGVLMAFDAWEPGVLNIPWKHPCSDTLKTRL